MHARVHVGASVCTCVPVCVKALGCMNLGACMSVTFVFKQETNSMLETLIAKRTSYLEECNKTLSTLPKTGEPHIMTFFVLSCPGLISDMIFLPNRNLL